MTLVGKLFGKLFGNLLGVQSQARSFEVHRIGPDGVLTVVASLAGDVRSYEDTDVAIGASYTYYLVDKAYGTTYGPIFATPCTSDACGCLTPPKRSSTPSGTSRRKCQ